MSDGLSMKGKRKSILFVLTLLLFMAICLMALGINSRYVLMKEIAVAQGQQDMSVLSYYGNAQMLSDVVQRNKDIRRYLVEMKSGWFLLGCSLILYLGFLLILYTNTYIKRKGSWFSALCVAPIVMAIILVAFRLAWDVPFSHDINIGEDLTGLSLLEVWGMHSSLSKVVVYGMESVFVLLCRVAVLVASFFILMLFINFRTVR